MIPATTYDLGTITSLILQMEEPTYRELRLFAPVTQGQVAERRLQPGQSGSGSPPHMPNRKATWCYLNYGAFWGLPLQAEVPVSPENQPTLLPVPQCCPVAPGTQREVPLAFSRSDVDTEGLPHLADLSPLCRWHLSSGFLIVPLQPERRYAPCTGHPITEAGLHFLRNSFLHLAFRSVFWAPGPVLAGQKPS